MLPICYCFFYVFLIRTRKHCSNEELDKIQEESDSEFDFSDEENYNALTLELSEDSDSEVSNNDNLSEGENNSDEDENIIDEGTIVDQVDSVNGWRKYSNNDADFQRLPFTVPTPGIQIPNNRTCIKEIDFFGKIFTDELLLQIVNETNRYAAEKLRIYAPLPRFSIWCTWKDVNLEEMKAFLGMHFLLYVFYKRFLDNYFCFYFEIKLSRYYYEHGIKSEDRNERIFLSKLD